MHTHFRRDTETQMNKRRQIVRETKTDRAIDRERMNERRKKIERLLYSERSRMVQIQLKCGEQRRE